MATQSGFMLPTECRRIFTILSPCAPSSIGKRGICLRIIDGHQVCAYTFRCWRRAIRPRSLIGSILFLFLTVCVCVCVRRARALGSNAHTRVLFAQHASITRGAIAPQPQHIVLECVCVSTCVDVHVHINCIYPHTNIKYLIPSARLRRILYGFTSIVCSPTHTDQCSSIIGNVCSHTHTAHTTHTSRVNART